MKIPSHLFTEEFNNVVDVSNSYFNPIIAVGLTTQVIFYSDTGEKLDYQISRDCQPTFLKWSPVNNKLAIGWYNGRILMFSEKKKKIAEEDEAHRTPILHIEWHY